MKHCNNCLKDYSEKYEFCPECGRLLGKKDGVSSSKKTIVYLIGLVLIIVAFLTLHEQMLLRRQQDAIKEGQYKRAIEEYRTTPTTADIEIVPGWQHYVKGNYIYIEGSVKNSSNKEIRYYEIGIKFLDNQGNVVDSSYTNGSDLGSGESKEFSTMHKNNSKYSKIKLYIKEVD